MSQSDVEPVPARPPAPRPLFFRADGQAAIERRGMPRTLGQTLAQDIYHRLRTTTWTRLFLIFLLLFVATNLFFAAILWFGDARIQNAHSHSFLDRFFFSVQTMATVGYGYMAPADALANWVVTFESFCGILITAVTTGIVFAKFGTPVAKVLWADSAVISRESGAPVLQFRMANARTAAIVEATVKVYLSWDETLPTGERARRIYDLHVRRNTSPFFALSWTVFHPIDEHSPLHGITPEVLADRTAQILISFTGIDDALATTVHARRSYPWTAIAWHQRYVDIIRLDTATNSRYLDYHCFHRTEPDDAPRAAA